LKKLLVLFSLASLLIPNTAFADDHTTSEDKRESLNLVSESFNGNEIYRVYESPNGQVYHHFISIPEEFVDSISNSEEPLVEAKKTLSSIYTNLGLEERLAEVNGEYYPDFGFIHLKAKGNVKTSFEKEKNIASLYAKGEKDKFDSLSKEDQEAMYDRSLPIYQDYSEIELGRLITDEEFEEYRKAEEADSIDPSIQQKKENTEDSSTAKTVGIILTILFLITVVVFVMLKRR